MTARPHTPFNHLRPAAKPFSLAALALFGLFAGCEADVAPVMRQPLASKPTVGPAADPTQAEVAVGQAALGKSRIAAQLDAATADLYSEAHYATTAIADPQQRELVEYGKALAERTWQYIGPKVDDPAMRLAGNGLACKNCHIKTGLQPFSAPWVGVTKRYPVFRSRENRIGSIEDRINGCMERSMNGKPLEQESREMLAFVAFMTWLSHRAPDDGNVEGSGFATFPFPDRAADLEHGKTVFATRCVACHGADGKGLVNPAGGYLFPPVVGADSYNNGAGMNRLLTAASFIQNNMPQGTTYAAPQLSIDEAFDVAAYVDSLPRPEVPNLEADFPDRKLKPMSTPYGPWADEFSAEQHKYGPYGEISAYYAEKHDIRKKQ